MNGHVLGLVYVGSLFKDDISAGAGGTLTLNHAAVDGAGADGRGPDLYFLWASLVWTAGSAVGVGVRVAHNSATANHDVDWYNSGVSGTTFIWTPPEKEDVKVLFGDSVDFVVVGSGALVPHLEVRYGIGVH